jgi:hypothetical protein
MERNADDTFGATGGQSSGTGGTESFGASGAGTAGSSVPSSGSDYSSTGGPGGQAGTSGASTGGMGGTGGTADTHRLDQVKSTAQDKLGQVKDKARDLQSTLADRLDAGAEKLRQRKQNATLAGATGTDGGSVGVASEERMTQVQDSVARGMSKSADWLRNGDMKADIEKQVRENPGRTLLVALGLGYLLGKAFRANK